MLMVGGSTPDLRRSDSGKLIQGEASSGTPLKRSTPLVAVPVSSTLSNSMRLAVTIQSGVHAPSGGRWQVE